MICNQWRCIPIYRCGWCYLGYIVTKIVTWHNLHVALIFRARTRFPLTSVWASRFNALLIERTLHLLAQHQNKLSVWVSFVRLSCIFCLDFFACLNWFNHSRIYFSDVKRVFLILECRSTLNIEYEWQTVHNDWESIKINFIASIAAAIEFSLFICIWVCEWFAFLQFTNENEKFNTKSKRNEEQIYAQKINIRKFCWKVLCDTRNDTKSYMSQMHEL